MSFKDRMQQLAKSKNSKIVLALDFPYEGPENRTKILSNAERILKVVHPYICAVKINHHLILPLGTFYGVKQVVNEIHDLGLMAIMDAKVNDIGNTNQVIAQYYYDVGFDALIANPFVGWDEGLKPIFDISKKLERGVILLCYMSHKGAIEGYGQTIIDPETGVAISQYLSFAKKALKWSADGVVVGATVPDKIIEVRKVLGQNVAIYSPGVGVQGGAAETAVKAGSDYLIVGREIVSASDPALAAQRLNNIVRAI